MGTEMKREEPNVGSKMNHIVMLKDRVEGTCMVVGTQMVRIDIEIHLILRKMVMEVVFIIESAAKCEINICIQKMIVNGSQV